VAKEKTYRPLERRYALIITLRVISENQTTFSRRAAAEMEFTTCLILEAITAGASSLSCLSFVAAAAAASETTISAANPLGYIR
jgi:hypothetical protein